MTSETDLTLGEFLRLERERRGITIEQVASATKINVRMLHSLEADQFAELPAKPFIRGFVTSYARFVGLNPKEILTRFGDFIDDKALDRPNREAGHSGYAFEKREGEQSRTILWLIMGGFTVIAAVGLVFFKPSRHHHGSTQLERLRDAHGVPSPEPSASPSPSPSLSAVLPSVAASASPTPSPTSKPEAASTAKPSPSPSPKVTPSASPSPVAPSSPSPNDPLNSGRDLKPDEIKQRVVFKALEDVWVRYQVDHRPMMKIVLRKDRVLVLRATESIRFQTSNPDNIQFNYNRTGDKLMTESKFATPRGDDLTLIFPAEAAKMIQDPFPGEKPLLGRDVPEPRNPTPSSTPTE